jgi:hypothetical protein
MICPVYFAPKEERDETDGVPLTFNHSCNIILMALENEQ